MRRQDFKEGYRPYINRFNSNPYTIPVTVFLVLFSLSIATFIGLRVRAEPPSDSRIIELSVDGTHQSVPTRATTVGEFLRRSSIRLAQNDIVEPASETPIDDEKFHINVYRARPVTIIEDGNRIFAYSAAATPRSVARQAGVTVYPEDKIDSAVPENFLKEGVLGEKVVIERATPTNLNLYGSHVPVRTHAKTVAELLKEKNIKLEANDSLQPAPETPITPQIQIFVTRSGIQVATAEEEITMPVEIIEDPSLSFGAQATRQQGSPGRKTVTYEITLENGLEVGRRKIQEVITVPPVKQIVARGPQGSFGQALAQLRQCEAGGNYHNKRNPTYRGAYQFNYSTWNNYAGYHDPADAPPTIQDQKATETYQRRGWQPWPACSRKLGLQDIYR